MRRFPIFLVLDVSESMVGTPLEQIEQGLTQITSDLLQDPYALETAWISVIAFAGKAMTLTPLTETFNFTPPTLPVGAGTGLGAALTHLMAEIDRNVTKTTASAKGDFKPLVFLMTDGHPTDDPESTIQRWVANYKDRVSLVAVSIGGQANDAMLRRLTSDVFAFDDRQEDSFKKFIAWVSASVSASARSVSTGGGIDLRKMDERIEVTPNPSSAVDDRFAVFTVRCARSKAPYVVKFEKGDGEARAGLFGGSAGPKYVLSQVVPVDDRYFSLSDASATSGQTMNTAALEGAPSCPHCGTEHGMALCECGGIHCVQNLKSETCPWCNKTSRYGFGRFSIGRGQG